MRFKISQQGPNRHTKMVTCVAWIASDEIYSCGDDHSLVCWKFEGGMINSKVITVFPDDFNPTDMHWHPRPVQSSLGAVKKGTPTSHDLLLMTTADGKFHLVTRNGRIEKSIFAHEGATIGAKWNNDGSAFFTAGEDGLIKTWSRSGMLRSTVIRGNQPILASAWSPDNSAILYSQGPNLYIQSSTTSAKPLRWQAHEGLILAAAWNKFHGLIVTGGEDCRHKVWDSTGNLLYASVIGDHPITSVNWCFSGSYFAVGSFCTLKLCDKTGWPHSLEKVQSGSIYDISWSSDGTQVALACSSGSVLIAHTIEKKLQYNGFEATLIKRKAIQVIEAGSDVNEILDIADRVIQLEFGFDHLIAITPSQCHIYSTKNWNTPAIFDLKNGSVSAVLLADKHFLLVEWHLLSLYNYQGRSLGTPKWKGMIMEPLYPPCISICSDTLVVRDQSNPKLLHVLEISTKKPITESQSYTHNQDVISLALNYVGGVVDRQLALIDSNRDLVLISIRSPGFGRVCKIAVMAQNIAWATDANVLAGMLDSTLSVWLCPNCVHYSDRKIIRKTRVDKDSSEFGKQPTIVSVKDGLVTVRRGDGAIVVSSFYTFFTSLHRHILNGRWEDAVSLCRIVQSETLWTCMAVMAIDSRQLNIAEEACAAIDRFDKVDYIRYIKKLPNEMERLAEMALLAGDLIAAEGILLQNGLVSEAIRINIEMFNWSRALELAIKHKKLLNEVLDERKKYLEVLGKKEINQSFLTVKSNLSKSETSKKEVKEKEKEEESEKESENERRKERDEERENEKKKEVDEERDKEREKERRREREEEKERERERRREREEEKERERERRRQREEERRAREEERKAREEEERRAREEEEERMAREEEKRRKEEERMIREEEKRKREEERMAREEEKRKREEEQETEIKEKEEENGKEKETERQTVKEKETERQTVKEKDKEKVKERETTKRRRDVRERDKGKEKEVVKAKERPRNKVKENERVSIKDREKSKEKVKTRTNNGVKRQASNDRTKARKSMTPERK